MCKVRTVGEKDGEDTLRSLEIPSARLGRREGRDGGSGEDWVWWIAEAAASMVAPRPVLDFLPSTIGFFGDLG